MSDLQTIRLDDPRLHRLFGAPTDSMAAITARAGELFPSSSPILWEGDPATFQFSYVSPNAEAILGYPASRWIAEPTFWADVVVHPDDRREAIAYCALATAKRRDHRFEYRARSATGRTLRLVDVVRVLPGPKGVPGRLRGIMFDITDAPPPQGALDLHEPTLAQLRALR